MSQTYHITFLPSQKTTTVAAGSSLLETARAAGIPIRSDCGGAGTCGQCRVLLVEDTGETEVLACQQAVERDWVVFVPRESLEQDQARIVVDSEHASFENADSQSPLRLVPLEIPSPSREDHRPDSERFANAALGLPTLSLQQLQRLPGRLRQANWQGTAAFLGERFVDFFPREETHAPLFAVAFDLGTTTLAAELLEFGNTAVASNSENGPSLGRIVAARANPQKRFGDDIISRIQKTIDDPKNLDRLQQAVLEAAAEMIGELAEQAGIDPRRMISFVLAGNTVMQQIFLGIDPSFLGFSPFVPATNRFPVVRAEELRLPIHPQGLVQTLPILGGFVGGDLVAGLLATGLDQGDGSDEPRLLIDIGTNGEMILVHGERIWAAATAAGPAFEGARIGHGMIAAPGAVDRVEFGESIRIGTIGDCEPAGICGSGLIDLTAELLRSGVLTARGQFASGTFREDIQQRLVSFEGKPAFRLSEPGKKEVVLTQKDVRQLQLAAGAIRCGVELLLQQAGLKADDLRRLDLAGGFGSFIRPESASRIGLFPPGVPIERIRFCGNTSLAGTKSFALDQRRQVRAESILERAEHIDLSTCPNFSQVFGECMIFPEAAVLG